MGETGAPPAKIPDATGHQPEKQPDSMWSALYQWITGRPNWVQNTSMLIVAIAIATGVGTFVVTKLSGVANDGKPAAATPTPAPSPPLQAIYVATPNPNGGSVVKDPGKGTQITPPGSDNNHLNVEAAARDTADDIHANWHTKHSEDDPKYADIFRIDAKNFSQYKYYDKTDRCLVIARTVDGFPLKADWIHDPNYDDNGQRKPFPVTTNSEPSRKRSVATLQARLGTPIAAWIPPVQTASFRHSVPDAELNPVSMQGPCLDPHPGAFNWWWGPPADQCWSPMYRRFGDGCTHYQMFNRCANAWDGRIFWVSCTPSPNGHF